MPSASAARHRAADPGAFPSVALAACKRCGMVHRIPQLVGPGHELACRRCDKELRASPFSRRTNDWAGACAVAACVIFIFALTLPIIRIEQFGHVRETAVLAGCLELLANDEIAVGVIVLLCSIVIPAGKLLTLVYLCYFGANSDRRTRARLYEVVELAGRWGMLDVFVVAALVAVLKLGNLVSVSGGPGAVVFALFVTTSLISSALFDPLSLWRDEEIND